MKYLGLDIGRKAIGIAVGEQLASELVTLRAAKDENFYQEPARGRSMGEIGSFVETENTSAIVVGLPVKEDGSHSEESKLIEAYATELESKLGIKLFRVDETLTSYMAEELLEGQGAERKEIEERRDQLSAQLILQQFLEENAPT
ncbi:MAG: Holliday junction resolvase RuvX [Candidatus Berkelbacteria bacterium]|nr:MAG: Holliday junction resolvase RuvX [Candidatus Berkelbacteria bacterium]QQG51882.1 MAG: Holliday junction resolvase RuvX [Candidatus Berkelbacteria bacterium]